MRARTAAPPTRPAMKPATIYLAVAAGFLLLLLVLRPDAGVATDPRSPRIAAPPTPPAGAAPAPAASPVASEERSPLADGLNAPAGTVDEDLRIVATLIEVFRSNFPREGNPTGSNAEITAALTGRNRLRLALVPPDHPALNARGELCDRWGTPFFFHSESRVQTEIRSAGPDRKHWTEDDVVTKQ
jgi:hypothetical protein